LSLTPEQLSLLLTVDPEVWREEASLIPPAYEKFGERLPSELWGQYDALVARLARAEVPEEAVA
jgi:phosphoenolpyruvate carboxykinase (GTP)